MRSRVPFFALLFLVSVFVLLPVAAHAGGIPFFGPIIPQEGDQASCAAGWGMIMIVINNIISFALTLAIVFIAPLMLAFAGFNYVVYSKNPGKRSETHDMLRDTILGLIIALAGWLIVNAVMAALYNPDAQSGTTRLDVWTSLIGGGDLCIEFAQPETVVPSIGTTPGTFPGTRPGIPLGTAAPQCASTNASCSPAALQSAGFTATQANVMSCIAMTESSGNGGVGCNGNACGLFQIMLTVNPLVGPACGGGSLNCPALCRGNNGAAVRTAACQPCVQAANNPQCNAQAARNLLLNSGSDPYRPWTSASDNTRSAACVQRYGGG